MTSTNITSGQDVQASPTAEQAPPAAEQARRAMRWGIFYYCRTQLAVMKAYWISVLLYGIGMPLLYLLALGVGLGGLLNSRGTTVDGVSYMVFVAPAIMVAGACQAAFGEATYPVMGGFKWTRNYFGPAATPLDPMQIGFGHLLAIAIRFGIQAVGFWLVMLLFGATHSLTSVLTIPIAVLASMAVAAPLMGYAAGLDSEGFEFSTIQRFVIMPMFLFAGTFFALDSMPVYLRWIGWISPVWHGSQLARWVSYGAAIPAWFLAVHLVVLLAFTAAGMLLVKRQFRRRLWS